MHNESIVNGDEMMQAELWVSSALLFAGIKIAYNI
jgi:hypothetical protein